MLIAIHAGGQVWWRNGQMQADPLRKSFTFGKPGTVSLPTWWTRKE